MGPIQLVPPGLMGLLQLKQEGRLPGTLNETVSCVIELRDWYMTARRQNSVSIFGAAPSRNIATGTTGVVVLQVAGVNAAVPQDEIWWIDQLQISGTFNVAGDTIHVAPLITHAVVADNVIVGPDYNDVINGRVRAFAARADRGFWALPGDLFGIFVYDVLAVASVPVAMTFRGTRLPI